MGFCSMHSTLMTLPGIQGVHAQYIFVSATTKRVALFEMENSADGSQTRHSAYETLDTGEITRG